MNHLPRRSPQRQKMTSPILPVTVAYVCPGPRTLRAPDRRLAAVPECLAVLWTPHAFARTPDSGCGLAPDTWSAAVCSVPPAGRSRAVAVFSCATLLFGSFISPNTIACVGHACCTRRHNLSIANRADPPSRPRSLPARCAGRSKCTSPSRRGCAPSHRDCASRAGSACTSRNTSKKLNRRTLYGQLFEQYRVPTQRL